MSWRLFFFVLLHHAGVVGGELSVASSSGAHRRYSFDLKSLKRTMTGLGQKAAAMVATPSASFCT